MNQLGLFAKFWQPGTVKTRLAANIGNEAACRLYRCFLFHLLEQLGASGHARDIVFSPPHRKSEFRNSVPTAWNLCPQADGNLGNRMETYFRIQFEGAAKSELDQKKVASKVVVIGADCPLLNAPIVDSAFELLDQVPVVIGPSHDGGYYLLGMREQCYDVFADVRWSTPDVFSQTIERLKNSNTDYAVLDPMNDIDELEDLQQLATQLQQTQHSQTKFSHLLEQVKLALAQSESTRETEQ